MKKLFLIITSIFLNYNSNSCGLPNYYTEEWNKNFLIPHLVTGLELNTRLFSTNNSLYYKLNYSIYDVEIDRQSNKLRKLGFSEDVIYLMNSNIVKFINLEHHFIKIEFNPNYGRTLSSIYELSITKFFNYTIIQEFAEKNQLDLLKLMMYRSIVLHGGKSSKYTKTQLKKFIQDEMKTCPDNLIEDYATLLIELSLKVGYSHEVVSDYMKYFNKSKELNAIAYSHFCGAVSAQYALLPTDDYFKFRNDRELSVYLFTKLLKYPKLLKQITYEINYVIDMKSDFDWEKCLSYCKTQKERDMIHLIKTTSFSGINISLIDYFHERTSQNSKTFELALIQYTKRVESSLFSNLYRSGYFKEGYTVNSKWVSLYDYADAVDLNKYLKTTKIQNKVLLHILRGYSSFMLGNFPEARKEYHKSRSLIRNATYLTKQQKTNYLKQLDGLELLEEFSHNYSEKDYHNLKERLTKFLSKTYLSDEMEAYFELGMMEAIKRHDFSTTLIFSSKNGFHQEIILDVIMDNKDLIQFLTILNKGEVPFLDRLPSDLKFAVIEQIATNYFREHDIINARKYFNLLPDYIFESAIGGKSYYDNKYGNDYTNFIVNTSDTETKSLKRYNKKSAVNAIYEIMNEITQKKSINYINDSLSLLGIRKEISNLYFDLSCIYSSNFWAYSRIWEGGLISGFHYAYYSPFNLIDSNVIRLKLDTYLNEYGSQNTSINYLQKALEFSDDSERQAKLNFKLIEKLKEPLLNSLHKWMYKSDKWETIISDYETKISSTSLLIDSLYQNTNYFKEVISECSDFKKSNLLESTNDGDNQTIINNTDVVTEHKDELRDIYKILSLLLLIIIITLFIYIKIKK